MVELHVVFFLDTTRQLYRCRSVIVCTGSQRHRTIQNKSVKERRFTLEKQFLFDEEYNETKTYLNTLAGLFKKTFFFFHWFFSSEKLSFANICMTYVWKSFEWLFSLPATNSSTLSDVCANKIKQKQFYKEIDLHRSNLRSNDL